MLAAANDFDSLATQPSSQHCVGSRSEVWNKQKLFANGVNFGFVPQDLEVGANRNNSISLVTTRSDPLSRGEIPCAPCPRRLIGSTLYPHGTRASRSSTTARWRASAVYLGEYVRRHERAEGLGPLLQGTFHSFQALTLDFDLRHSPASPRQPRASEGAPISSHSRP